MTRKGFKYTESEYYSAQRLANPKYKKRTQYKSASSRNKAMNRDALYRNKRSPAFSSTWSRHKGRYDTASDRGPYSYKRGGTIYTGPRGGRYRVSGAGNKYYVGKGVRGRSVGTAAPRLALTYPGFGPIKREPARGVKRKR